jgi:tetratricopeptide (TPR) repeat protein
MGLTEELITSLGYVDGLLVSARSAVLAYLDKPIDPREVGRRLGVEAILTGTVGMQSPGVFMVAAELAETQRAAHLWSLQQAVAEGELTRVKGTIASKVAATLHLKPGAGGQQAFPAQTESGAAYRDYLYGRYALNKRTLAGYRQAVEYFQRAVAGDGSFGPAWAGLADSYAFQGGPRPPKEVFPLARQAVEKGLAANPGLAELHASAGFILLQYDWDWGGAEREFQTALRINGNDGTARGRYARLLMVLGRFAEAEQELLRVQKLDPVSLTTGATLANCYYLSRRYNQALKQIGRVLELEPNFMPGLDLKADVLVEKGSYAEAIAIYEREVASQPDDAGAIASLVRAAVLAKDKARTAAGVETFRKLAAARPVNPSATATVELAMGAADKAIVALQEGFRQRYWPLIFLKVSPQWDSLRGRVEFQNLLRELHLA